MPHALQAGVPNIARDVGRRLATHDWVAVVYGGSFAAALLSVAAPAALQAAALLLFVATAAAILWCRSSNRPSPYQVLAYRSGFVGLVLGSYLMLRWALPLLTGATYDDQLERADRLLFGGHFAAERWLSPGATEVLSAAYLSYFPLLALACLVLVLARGPERADGELVVGLLLAYGVGHGLYALVPAYGPVGPHLSSLSSHGGPVHDAMVDFVQGHGALLDAFPSMHTAAPAVIAAWAFQHRRRLGHLWVPLTTLVASIASSAVLLGWHYVIDIAAGLLLAGASHLVARRIARFEESRRAGRELGAFWPALELEASTAARPRAAAVDDATGTQPSLRLAR